MSDFSRSYFAWLGSIVALFGAGCDEVSERPAEYPSGGYVDTAYFEALHGKRTPTTSAVFSTPTPDRYEVRCNQTADVAMYESTRLSDPDVVERAMTDCGLSCAARNAASCYRAGEILAQPGIRERARADEMFARACDLGDRRGCANWDPSKEPLTSTTATATTTTTAAAPPPSPIASVAIDAVDVRQFWDRCSGGEGRACLAIGVHFLGAGRGHNAPLAATYFDLGCDNGNASSCAARASMYESGVETVKDPARAALLYQRACDFGDVGMCRRPR